MMPAMPESLICCIILFVSVLAASSSFGSLPSPGVSPPDAAITTVLRRSAALPAGSGACPPGRAGCTAASADCSPLAVRAGSSGLKAKNFVARALRGPWGSCASNEWTSDSARLASPRKPGAVTRALTREAMSAARASTPGSAIIAPARAAKPWASRWSSGSPAIARMSSSILACVSLRGSTTAAAPWASKPAILASKVASVIRALAVWTTCSATRPASSWADSGTWACGGNPANLAKLERSTSMASAVRRTTTATQPQAKPPDKAPKPKARRAGLDGSSHAGARRCSASMQRD
mmetsp:Transcript_83062/g.235642  ORF Transcript_83062/g.235642 Transcript_83062/m.235642 type:complete len:294 (-) Transcript_83062:60-941(-)